MPEYNTISNILVPNEMQNTFKECEKKLSRLKSLFPQYKEKTLHLSKKEKKNIDR